MAVDESGSEDSEAADRPESSNDSAFQIKELSIQMWFRKWAASGNLISVVTDLVPLESFAAERPERATTVPQSLRLPARLGSTCPGGRQTHPAWIRVPESHLPTQGGRAGMQACWHCMEETSASALQPLSTQTQLCCRDLTRQTQRRQPPFLFSQSHSLSTPRLYHIFLIFTTPSGDLTADSNLISPQPFRGNQR